MSNPTLNTAEASLAASVAQLIRLEREQLMASGEDRDTAHNRAIAVVSEWMERASARVKPKPNPPGRPRTISDAQIAEMRRMKQGGATNEQIGQRFGMSRWTVWYWVSNHPRRSTRGADRRVA